MSAHPPLYYPVPDSDRDIDDEKRIVEAAVFNQVYNEKVTIEFNENCTVKQYCKATPVCGFISLHDGGLCEHCPAWIQAVNHMQFYAHDCSGDGHDCKECYFGSNAGAIKQEFCPHYPWRMNLFYRLKDSHSHSAFSGLAPRDRTRDDYFRRMKQEEIYEQRRRAQFQF